MARRKQADALTLFDSLVYTCLYRVSIDPPSATHAWVMQVRHQLRDRIGMFENFYRMPGVTLLEADLPPEYERPLADSLSRGAAAFRAFDLRFTGLRASVDRRSILIALEPEGPVNDLRARLSMHVGANRRIRKLGVEDQGDLGLAIASGLKAAQFEAAWAMIGSEAYNAERRVSDVQLIKREWSDTSMDEHVGHYRLES
jgi:hypothetical protein